MRGEEESGDYAAKQEAITLCSASPCSPPPPIRRYLRTNSGCVSWDTTTHAVVLRTCVLRVARAAARGTRAGLREELRVARSGARAV